MPPQHGSAGSMVLPASAVRHEDPHDTPFPGRNRHGGRSTDNAHGPSGSDVGLGRSKVRPQVVVSKAVSPRISVAPDSPSRYPEKRFSNDGCRAQVLLPPPPSAPPSDITTYSPLPYVGFCKHRPMGKWAVYKPWLTSGPYYVLSTESVLPLLPLIQGVHRKSFAGAEAFNNNNKASTHFGSDAPDVWRNKLKLVGAGATNDTLPPIKGQSDKWSFLNFILIDHVGRPKIMSARLNKDSDFSPARMDLFKEDSTKRMPHRLARTSKPPRRCQHHQACMATCHDVDASCRRLNVIAKLPPSDPAAKAEFSRDRTVINTPTGVQSICSKFTRAMEQHCSRVSSVELMENLPFPSSGSWL
jgi:hypothetical protein